MIKHNENYINFNSDILNLILRHNVFYKYKNYTKKLPSQFQLGSLEKMLLQKFYFYNL